MGLFVFLNAAFVGFFAFAAAYHLILWTSSRRETLLAVFGLDCGLRAALGSVLAAVAVSTTTAGAHDVLRARIAIALVVSVTWLWSLSLVSGVRARWFVWPVTILLLILFPIQAFIVPLNAPVLSVEQVTMPWGETISNPQLGPPGWWFIPIYSVVVAIECFGLVCGSRLWRRDRVAGLLVLMAVCGTLLIHGINILRGYRILSTPFFGLIPHIPWVCLISLLIARENRKTRISLRETSEFNRQIIASVTDGLIVIDRDLKYQVWNPEMERISGLPAEKVIGKTPHELFPFLEDAGVLALIERALAGETVISPEFPYHVPTSGNVGWTSQSMGPLRSVDGTTIGVITTVREVTERILAEKALRESEARYRTLVEYAPEAIVVFDAQQGTFIDVNQNACRLFGLSRDELLRHGPEELSPPLQPDGLSSSESAQQKIELALAGQVPRFAWVHRDASGRDIPCEVSLVRLPSETSVLVRGSIVDVSLRKRAEELLRRKDAELRRLFESNLVGILFLRVDGTITEANDYFLNLVGYSREDQAQGNVDWAEVTPPEFQQLDEQSLADIRQSGKCAPFEKEYIHKNGGRVPVLVGAGALDDESGRCVAFILDLTQRKRLEQQFRQSQKMEAIGQLAGGVAHDFNNLITIIDGYCELLLERFREQPPAQQMLGEIGKAAERAAMLTRQLLAFSRRQLLTPKVLNLNVVINEIELMLRRLIGEDVILSITLDPDLGLVKADPGQLEQVVMNMAVNARDAMPRGGILTLTTQNVMLNAANRGDLPPGRYSQLTITDTGTGMSEQTKAHLFEPFYTTKQPGKGTGLGLATSHGIINQSGGSIEVDSESGMGTAFRIYLPIVEEPATQIPMPSKPGDFPRGTELILLVEDEDPVRSLVREFLTGCGYTVLEAENGKQAIQIAEDNTQIELLLSDVVMPLLGGRELAEQITLLCPNCKVLFLSGYTDDAVIRHGVMESQFAFLSKPFTQLQLTQKVREVLERAA